MYGNLYTSSKRNGRGRGQWSCPVSHDTLFRPLTLACLRAGLPSSVINDPILEKTTKVVSEVHYSFLWNLTYPWDCWAGTYYFDKSPGRPDRGGDPLYSTLLANSVSVCLSACIHDSSGRIPILTDLFLWVQIPKIEVKFVNKTNRLTTFAKKSIWRAPSLFVFSIVLVAKIL